MGRRRYRRVGVTYGKKKIYRKRKQKGGKSKNQKGGFLPLAMGGMAALSALGSLF